MAFLFKYTESPSSVGFITKAQKQPVTRSLKPQSTILPESKLLRPRSFPPPSRALLRQDQRVLELFGSDFHKRYSESKA